MAAARKQLSVFLQLHSVRPDLAWNINGFTTAPYNNASELGSMNSTSNDKGLIMTILLSKYRSNEKLCLDSMLVLNSSVGRQNVSCSGKRVEENDYLSMSQNMSSRGDIHLFYLFMHSCIVKKPTRLVTYVFICSSPSSLTWFNNGTVLGAFNGPNDVGEKDDIPINNAYNGSLSSSAVLIGRQPVLTSVLVLQKTPDNTTQIQCRGNDNVTTISTGKFVWAQNRNNCMDTESSSSGTTIASESDTTSSVITVVSTYDVNSNAIVLSPTMFHIFFRAVGMILLL